MRSGRGRTAVLAVGGGGAAGGLWRRPSQDAVETVTSFVTAGPPSRRTPSTSAPAGEPRRRAPSPTGRRARAPAAAAARRSRAAAAGGRRAAAAASCRRSCSRGEKPPQFIVVSFDGVGWHEKWQHWFDVAKQVPFHFTGFLSGTYMLSDETKMAYTGPGHSPGKSSISWNTAADLPTGDRRPEPGLQLGQRDRHALQRSLLRGRRAQRQLSGRTADWNNELDQFFALMANVKANNPGVTHARPLAFDGSVDQGRAHAVPGGARPRTLFPALIAHNMTYDSSFTEDGHLAGRRSRRSSGSGGSACRRSRSTAPARSRS